MREQSVGAVTVGTDYASSATGVELAEAAEGIWATIAVHPDHVHKPHHDHDELAEEPKEEIFEASKFAALAERRKVVAIGETGLDYYRLPQDEDERRSAKEKQRENFARQIEFAQEHGLPLVMHVRDAQEDAFAMLKGAESVTGVMHCFTGTPEEAEMFLGLGLHVSFSGIVTFPPRRTESENPLAKTVRAVPVERMLVETDAPWLSPAPDRGKRNEPIGVLAVSKAVAAMKCLEVGEIERITKENAFRLFRLAQR
jgi:TatD DNase family protein